MEPMINGGRADQMTQCVVEQMQDERAMVVNGLSKK